MVRQRKKRLFTRFCCLEIILYATILFKIGKNPVSITLSRLRDLAKILDVSLLTLIGEENKYFIQNINPPREDSDNKLVLNQANSTSEQNELFKGMQSEIVFLRDLVLKLQT